MPRILQDGEWRLIYVYNKYRILHHCAKGVYSWQKHEKDRAWTAVGEVTHTCCACEAVPPNEMAGFINLLNWER